MLIGRIEMKRFQLCDEVLYSPSLFKAARALASSMLCDVTEDCKTSKRLSPGPKANTTSPEGVIGTIESSPLASSDDQTADVIRGSDIKTSQN